MREVKDGKGSGTRRVIGALLGPVWRSLPWRVLGAAGALGLPAAGSVRLMSGAGGPDPALGLGALRLVALLGGFGLAFLFDDPARDTTSAVPVRRALRAAVRLALVAPLAAAWWTAALFLVPDGARPPAGALTLEAAAVAAAALALASASVRLRAEPAPGAATALALLALAVAALLAPARWNPLPAPGDPDWAAAHHWWTAALGAAAVICAACLPEPRARRRCAARPKAAGVRPPSGT
ncbi:ABC transporter [Streptomyces sp. NPDC021356]|uniref:ABC transporter n=1 Tax=Streptomyces sp. NPDC021356 TaxID=3154900 RepID=UPI0033E56BEE